MQNRRSGSIKKMALLLPLAALFTLPSCSSRPKFPAPDSKEYKNVVSAFYIGLSALQVGDDVHAEAKLSELTQLVPGEPSGWANWGILALRQRNYDLASQRLEKARDLAPKNDQIHNLLGILESQRGNSAAALADFRKASELNPQNLRAMYSLAEETERQGGANSDSDFQALLQKILTAQPENLAALLELSRASAKRGDSETLKSALNQLSSHSASWPAEAQKQFAAVQTAVSENDLRAAATQTTFLRNVLMRDADYRHSLRVIKAAPGDEAEPFTRFLLMPTPVFKPAPADVTLTFNAQPLAQRASGSWAGNWSWIGAISLGSAGAPVAAVANGHEVRLASGATLPFPGGPSVASPQPEGIVPVDFNYDFKTDLVLAGAGGVRFMRQDNLDVFTDVTSKTKLPKSVTGAPYTGAWAVDIEADGDLDVVLGVRGGVPTVLRNNGDDTFLAIHPFAGIQGLRAFAWADLDGDGNPDAAIIDGAGKLHVFMNERQGQFRERALPGDFSSVKAVAVADNDGTLDLLALRSDGAIVRISDKNDGQSWETAEIAHVPNPAHNLAGEVRLRVADLDNNGALDLLLCPTSKSDATAALIWLGDEKGGFTLLDHPAGPPLVFASADLKGTGRLDLLGLSADGQPVDAVNQSSKNYHWQVVRPHAVQAVGDQRINPFGVGGEIEVRSGLLVQKQPITGPLLHFGLGEQTEAEVVRVVWPNGTVRAEFGVKADQDVVTEQRLKASCPFLFAYNGKEMEFVKDAVPWGSAIGLRINTLGSAQIAATGEWYKIGRDQLVPHDGYYDIRITAELWEVYYYDWIVLTTVDHPANTEIYVDERFVIPPARLGFTTVYTPHEIAHAVDDTGQDVTELVRTLDGKAVSSFGRGQFQGVTRDHYLEVDLGDDAPKSGPLYLIAQGSIHDTESSVNVAITQGNRWHAHGLSVEVPDGHGRWVTAQDNLGFPAGRKKTILFNLTNIFKPGTPRRVRLRTNLEIYWDAIHWAEGAPDAPVKETTLDPTVADLHYRGYSVMHMPTTAARAPEVPDYNQIEGTKQRWRDLIGYYTRYGDIRDLLRTIDDRYVIVNSGDEMSLRFAEQPPPPSGWVRDFVIKGDGWIKDGDYNSTWSKTVLPLPYHAKNEYTTRPGALEEEWVYKQHPDDWRTYHTRYVTPEVFKGALRNGTTQ
jgi:Tfp pilus assembly protein PilF